ncbi:MAG: hypothetical protein U0235_19870 [Polyangiaceae bacterium]
MTASSGTPCSSSTVSPTSAEPASPLTGMSEADRLQRAQRSASSTCDARNAELVGQLLVGLLTTELAGTSDDARTSLPMVSNMCTGVRIVLA